METRVCTVIASHLSDALIEMTMAERLRMAQHRINFVKYLCFHYHDTNDFIDADKAYDSFLLRNRKEAEFIRSLGNTH